MKSQIDNLQSTIRPRPEAALYAKRQGWRRGFVAACLLATAVAHAADLGTAFTYQGYLEKPAGTSVNDTCDFEFAIYEDSSGTMQVGTAQTVSGVTVSSGVFTVGPPDIDFGEGAFNGEARWLKVSVCCPATCSPVGLSPLIELTPTPNAIRAYEGVGPPEALEVDTTTGNVGIGTLTPAQPLDVNGDIHANARVALGNDGVIGQDGAYAHIFDLSHTITDFSSSESWEGFDSTITLDPAIDLTGTDARYLYSHDFHCLVPGGNTHDFEFVAGPFHTASHAGSGTVNLLGGSLLGAQTHSGTTASQIGAQIASQGGPGPATITRNVALEIVSGHWGTGGSVGDSFGLLVNSPAAASPLTNHYGLYLQNQDFGTADSYAIYSDGGTSYLAGNVGIGTESPAAKLDVTSTAQDTTVHAENTATSGVKYGGYFHSRSPDGYGVYGLSDGAGSGAGVYGQTMANGPAAFGVKGEAPGGSYGGLGWGYNDIGVYGLSPSTSGYGVFGIANASSGTTYGVWGQTHSSNGYGVYGLASASVGVSYGVYGRSNSTSGVGVIGVTNTSSGTNYGVWGQTLSTDGYGVFGLASASNGNAYGVAGKSNSTNGVGVFGYATESFGFTTGVEGVSSSTNGTGVYGRATSENGLTFGVVGISSSPTGYGVYSNGNLKVDGDENDGSTAAMQVESGSQRLLVDGNEIDSNGALHLNNNSTNDVILGNGGGFVGIGDATPDAKLDVVGDIHYTGTITDVSDERTKENITPMVAALDKVCRLRGVYFNMKDRPDTREVGLIAQNVREVLPEAVSVVDPEYGYLGVSYPSLIPLLVEAVKEMQGKRADADGMALAAIQGLYEIVQEKDCEIEELRSEIEDLKKLVKELAAQNGGGR